MDEVEVDVEQVGLAVGAARTTWRSQTFWLSVRGVGMAFSCEVVGCLTLWDRLPSLMDRA